MTAVDPINDPASATISREVQLDSLPTEAHESKVTPMERAEKEQLVLRIDQLPRDIGWLLIYVGALGFVLPGILDRRWRGADAGRTEAAVAFGRPQPAAVRACRYKADHSIA